MIYRAVKSMWSNGQSVQMVYGFIVEKRTYNLLYQALLSAGMANKQRCRCMYDR